jgi:hypothetical protein
VSDEFWKGFFTVLSGIVAGLTALIPYFLAHHREKSDIRTDEEKLKEAPEGSAATQIEKVAEPKPRTKIPWLGAIAIGLALAALVAALWPKDGRLNETVYQYGIKTFCRRLYNKIGTSDDLPIPADSREATYPLDPKLPAGAEVESAWAIPYQEVSSIVEFYKFQAEKDPNNPSLIILKVAGMPNKTNSEAPDVPSGVSIRPTTPGIRVLTPDSKIDKMACQDLRTV